MISVLWEQGLFEMMCHLKWGGREVQGRSRTSTFTQDDT